MPILFFWLILTAKAYALDFRSDEYYRTRKALGQIESGNDPTARNKRTSASGKYQFMRLWDGWFNAETGKTWSETVPKKGTKNLEKYSKEQDRLFDTYFVRRVSPWLVRNRDKGRALGYSDSDLVAIYHRQGESGATRFLKTGKDPFKGKYSNPHLKTHIARMRKAMTTQLARR